MLAVDLFAQRVSVRREGISTHAALPRRSAMLTPNLDVRAQIVPLALKKEKKKKKKKKKKIYIKTKKKKTQHTKKKK
eukprot:NODE_26078_length_565_cov_1.799087.p2 GENE.NODE_26078_length_565_cov_1.799087~~NODE_26078_length_565_cov_1.799087.p2  ORF type:complete len:77 (-),score=42.70 NODE_26078_length_565_cov_1.799087:90-320(-)